jgi:hypothetical protein
VDDAAFLLDDLAFPLTTETPEFSIDDFQWDTSSIVELSHDAVTGYVTVHPLVSGTVVISPLVSGVARLN